MALCRICLSDVILKKISDIEYRTDGQTKNGLEILWFCLNIKLENENVSAKICLKCYRRLTSFYNFKVQALKNNVYYETINKENIDEDEKIVYKNDIKHEPDCLEDDNNVGIELENCDIDTVKSEHEEIIFQSEGGTTNCDDELLSVIKEHSYFNNKLIENKCVKKKRGRPKNVSTKVTKKVSTHQVCDKCGKVVKHLKEHAKSHLPVGEKKQIKCNNCSKTFNTDHAKYKHNQIKHRGLKKLCEICNKEMECLKMHMLVVHCPEKLKHECSTCKKRFLTKGLLDQHMRIHTKTKPFECSHCTKRFRTKLLLTDHIRRIHDKIRLHICQFCSKGFFKKDHLHVHIRTHTKEKPYKCEKCGKAFSTKGQTQAHEARHTGVKSYPCSFCDKSFYNNGARSTHMVSHTKDRNYPCRYCDMRFGRSQTKLRHERAVHEKHLLSA